MSDIVSYEEAKENLSNKDFIFIMLDGKEVCYHEKLTSSHISAENMRKVLLKSTGLEEFYSPLKIKYENFKNLMTCSWSKERYNTVIDKHKVLNTL